MSTATMNRGDHRCTSMRWSGAGLLLLALVLAPLAHAQDEAKNKKTEKPAPERVVDNVKQDLKRASKAIDRSVEQANKEVRKVLSGKH